MTIDDYEGERVLISYDVAGSERSVAARVCQIVFGRSKDRTPGPDERRAEGFIWRRGTRPQAWRSVAQRDGVPSFEAGPIVHEPSRETGERMNQAIDRDAARYDRARTH